MVLVNNRASLISAGTEAQMIAFAKKSLLQKAKSRPDLVKQVLQKAKTDGFLATYKTVQDRLDSPTPLGYSSAGVVIEAGGGIRHVKVGDRVACAGAGYASHAEAVIVPRNLVVPIPENVSFEDASFATVGAIALQGVRVSDVRLGERVVVIGLGLIGLITVQILKAAGCMVLGADLNPKRVAQAKELGADEAYVLDDSTVDGVLAFTGGRGADCVIITAATDSSGPIETAGLFARLKGRVVVVGQVGMNVPRRDFYYKELDIRMSMSYGPGRYDPNFEERGVDYPYAYVPFTEKSNLETFLTLISQGKVTPGKFITHRFAITDAEKAYAIVKGEVKEPYLGLIFEYPELLKIERIVAIKTNVQPAEKQSAVSLGVIGAGGYCKTFLLPKFKNSPDVRMKMVSTSRGISADDAAKKFDFEVAATDSDALINDPEINTIVIATRHDSHARLTIQGLKAKKNVFVEKPLACNDEELRQVVEAAETSGRVLQVGFNRRFSPLIQQAKAKLKGHSQPLSMIYRINAGALPADHWHNDPTEGGGRIIGEGCHFIDLMQFLSGSKPVSVVATSVGGPASAIPNEDIITITVKFEDGSIGTLHYFANGDKIVPKEYLEVFTAGKSFILENFVKARFAEGGKFTEWKAAGQDKGQNGELDAFIDAIKKGGEWPIPLDELVATTLTTFRAMDSLRLGQEVAVAWAESAVE